VKATVQEEFACMLWNRALQTVWAEVLFEMLFALISLWRYSRPAWTRSCAACCRWPCLGRGVGLTWPTEVPSNPYHSVTLWFQLCVWTYVWCVLVADGICSIIHSFHRVEQAKRTKKANIWIFSFPGLVERAL